MVKYGHDNSIPHLKIISGYKTYIFYTYFNVAVSVVMVSL